MYSTHHLDKPTNYFFLYILLGWGPNPSHSPAGNRCHTPCLTPNAFLFGNTSRGTHPHRAVTLSSKATPLGPMDQSGCRMHVAIGPSSRRYTTAEKGPGRMTQLRNESVRKLADAPLESSICNK